MRRRRGFGVAGGEFEGVAGDEDAERVGAASHFAAGEAVAEGLEYVLTIA